MGKLVAPSGDVRGGFINHLRDFLSGRNSALGGALGIAGESVEMHSALKKKPLTLPWAGSSDDGTGQ